MIHFYFVRCLKDYQNNIFQHFHNKLKVLRTVMYNMDHKTHVYTILAFKCVNDDNKVGKHNIDNQQQCVVKILVLTDH